VEKELPMAESRMHVKPTNGFKGKVRQWSPVGLL